MRRRGRQAHTSPLVRRDCSICIFILVRKWSLTSRFRKDSRQSYENINIVFESYPCVAFASH